jgi:7-carboxy-7-deazaguanine synthase
MARTAPPGEDRFHLSELYVTVQGESSLVGVPTIFVRLYHCNLRCVWCDSMWAVEGDEYVERDVDDVVAEIRKLAGPGGRRVGLRHVCWTGGEPLLQWRALAKAVRILPDRFVHSVETDGEVDLGPFDAAVREAREDRRVRYIMDVKCPGSGMKARKVFANFRHLRPCDEVKFVLLDREDYAFAKEVLDAHDIPAGTILFSPVAPAHKVEEGLDPAVLARWIMDDRLAVRLQPQVHKFIWPGRERGI